jgi:hypothetical protein
MLAFAMEQKLACPLANWSFHQSRVPADPKVNVVEILPGVSEGTKS